MEDIKKFITEKFDTLDMDNYFVVYKLAEEFTRWLRWNKTYEDIEVFEPKEFRTIVVVHNIGDVNSGLTMYSSWEFFEDVKEWLIEYVNHEMEDEELHDLYYDDVYSFWNNLSLFKDKNSYL